MSKENLKGNSIKKLTGKQRAFVTAYLANNFNAAQAAKDAGYQANSQHSFEAIGSENLLKPNIKAAIDEHFAEAHLDAEEVLQELAKLARGNSKDKIRALALLSQHHGLLDGSGRAEEERRRRQHQATLNDEVAKAIEQVYGNMNIEIEAFNKKQADLDRKNEAQWRAIIRRYQHSAVTVEALRLLREVIHGRADVETLPEDFEPEVEIIPPSRRLQPAAVERMMREAEQSNHDQSIERELKRVEATTRQNLGSESVPEGPRVILSLDDFGRVYSYPMD